MPALQSLLARAIDLPAYLSARGRVFTGSDSGPDQLVTGQTSYVQTTPTFMIDVPATMACIPLLVRLEQSGTVAGAAINVLIEKDNVDRYASGGTAETTYSDKGRTALCNLYSNPTGNAGYGVRLAGYTLGPDVSPAEGAVQEVLWAPLSEMEIIEGPGAFVIYTYAGTTGPSWLWTIKWAEVPIDWAS